MLFNIFWKNCAKSHFPALDAYPAEIGGAEVK
jgi:hypothetical protein